MIRIYKYVIPVFLAAVSVSCAKEPSSGAGSPEITFSVNVGDVTKAAGLYTSDKLDAIAEFMVTGYDETSKKVDNQKVVKSDNVWKFASNPKMWEEGKTMTFWADANMPSYASTTTSSAASISLSISEIPTTVSSQWDPLIGYYNGNGNGEGKAEITFYHPLTAVQFKAGDKSEVITGINSIKLTGVHQKGNVTVTSSGDSLAYAWSKTGTKYVTSSFTGDLSQPLLLIPQDVSSDNISIEVTVNLNAGVTKTLSTSLKTGNWQAGYLNTYTLDMIGPSMMETLKVTLTDWVYINSKSGKKYFDANFDD